MCSVVGRLILQTGGVQAFISVLWNIVNKITDRVCHSLIKPSE